MSHHGRRLFSGAPISGSGQGPVGQEIVEVEGPTGGGDLSPGKAVTVKGEITDPTFGEKYNPGMPLDLKWIESVRANKSGLEMRAAQLGGRRTVKKDYQAAWLLRAISCIDLTTLSGDDTEGNVRRLCAKAANPVRQDILSALNVPSSFGLTTGAVCVYPARVKDAVSALSGTGIPVASVATGFPSGQIKLEHKLAEIEQCVEDGAREIDIVLSRDKCLRGDWEGVYEEVKLFKQACGPSVSMKTILATGELGTYATVTRASLVCMMAGADFIKTSTGKESVNATLPVSLAMMRAIRDYYDASGKEYRVGYKPAGGISTAKDSLLYLALVKDELGDTWLNKEMFRFGASSLLGDCERQLHHNAFGEYAADYYMPSA
eukprot:CAMPEP_0182499602 /NCGR_PEP_ID=MMETSP1321-20130603/7851_1 /TAXON_ID=91990 /ORGANISM="Bolidomonas sp., Strain RCC1657" /LENGTH=375 /DNA_ID=CAMNT_0024703831 /DNA_START=151 /DNA_END=1274 /DNA_ORIENTATION=+